MRQELSFAETYHLLFDQIAQMDARLSRQFVEQSGVLLAQKEDFEKRLVKIAVSLDALHSRLAKVEKALGIPATGTEDIMIEGKVNRPSKETKPWQ